MVRLNPPMNDAAGVSMTDDVEQLMEEKSGLKFREQKFSQQLGKRSPVNESIDQRADVSLHNEFYKERCIRMIAEIF